MMFKKENATPSEDTAKKEAASEIFIEVPKPQPKKETPSEHVKKSDIEDFVKSAKALSEEDIKDGEVVVLKDCPLCCVDEICSNFRGCHYKPAMVGGDLVYPA
jgi:hypothetical protein|tara:strand:- start:17848 stop:18156 length:309 start_codon:yes stop_codon:yes gene_type:complete